MANYADLSTKADADLYRATQLLNPILSILHKRVSALHDTVENMLDYHCLNTLLCDHLSVASKGMRSYMRAAEFLDKPALQKLLPTRTIAYQYRELIRILFELHPSLLEMTKPMPGMASLKKGAWEALQFKLMLTLMEVERTLKHPDFMEHAMVIEELVLKNS